MRSTEVDLDHLEEVHKFMQAAGFSDRAVAVAATAVILGGKRLLRYHQTYPSNLQVVYKDDAGKTPFSKADTESENEILTVLRTAYPEHRIKAEESGDNQRNSPHIWCVDPLDGTTGYIKGFKDAAVGAVHYLNGKPKEAAICDPWSGKLQIAEEGIGAFSYPLTKKLKLIDSPEKD